MVQMVIYIKWYKPVTTGYVPVNLLRIGHASIFMHGGWLDQINPRLTGAGGSICCPTPPFFCDISRIFIKPLHGSQFLT